MTTLPLVREFTDHYGIATTFYEWPAANPKGIALIQHGLGDHARRYDHVAIALTRAGYTVYADDHRGHGVTGRKMVAAGITKRLGNLGPGGMNAVYRATLQLRELAANENPGLPVALIGHSWGSMIAQRLLDVAADKFDAVALTGSTLLLPGILPTGGFNKKFVAQKTKQKKAVSGWEWLSRDESVGVAMKQDPASFPETAMQVFGVANALKLLGVPKRIPSHLPIRLIAGAEDVLGAERGNLLLAKAFVRAGSREVSTVIYPGARHEVFNEINREEVIADLIAWLNQFLAKPNSR
jgi:alpha-beta hydrolase superfamily lysophospholipase